MSSEVDNIIEVLSPRELIGQAVDLLMAQEDVSRDAAYELLVQSSSSSHRRVRQIAADIVQQRDGT